MLHPPDRQHRRTRRRPAAPTASRSTASAELPSAYGARVTPSDLADPVARTAVA